MCIYNVGGPCQCEQLPNASTVLEGMHGHGFEKLSKPCLGGTIAPHLGKDGVGRMERSSSATGGSQKVASSFLAPVDRYQEPSIEDQRP